MESLLKDTNESIVLSESIFNYTYKKSLIHQVITSYKTKSRQGSRAQKSRSDVIGSNKKPWRQKGTGRARAGSVKSPIWRSGGVTFAAKPKNYQQKINKKMYKNAIKSILSELFRKERLIFFKKFFLKQPKTKFLYQKLKNMNLEHVLIITNQIDKNLILASRNLYKVNTIVFSDINPINLISFKKVIILENAVKNIEDILK